MSVGGIKAEGKDEFNKKAKSTLVLSTVQVYYHKNKGYI